MRHGVLAAGAVVTVLLVGACGTQQAENAGHESPAESSSTSPTSASPSKQSTKPSKENQEPAEPTTQESEPPQPRIAAKCDTSNLAPSVRQGDSAAGNRYAWLVLTNTSKTTCTLYGYGGMQLYDDDHNKVPTHLIRDRSAAPVTLKVAPGDSVRSSLHWSAIPHSGDRQQGKCQPEPAIARVTPPDETQNEGVQWRLGSVCDSGRIVQGAYQGTALDKGD